MKDIFTKHIDLPYKDRSEFRQETYEERMKRFCKEEKDLIKRENSIHYPDHYKRIR